MLKAAHGPGTESLFMLIKGDSSDSDPTDIVLLSIAIQNPVRDDERSGTTLILLETLPGWVLLSYVIDASFPRTARNIIRD